jgi:hypothetical protein
MVMSYFYGRAFKAVIGKGISFGEQVTEQIKVI